MSRDGHELASTSMIFSICVFFFFLQWKKNLVLPEFGLSDCLGNSTSPLSLVVILHQILCCQVHNCTLEIAWF